VDITDNPHNGAPFVFTERHSLADRVGGWPERARHGLVDGDHQRAVLIIGGAEAAAALHGNTDGFEITSADRTVIHQVKFARRLRGPAFHHEGPGTVGAAQRKISRERGGLHAGNGPHPVEQSLL
jgi:hypothetical protein